MQKYIPTQKLSKKARKELAKAQRATWGPLNPMTRRPDDPKKYNRQKSRREEKLFDDGIFICICT